MSDSITYPIIHEVRQRSEAYSRSNAENAATRIFVVALDPHRLETAIPSPSDLEGLPSINDAHPSVPSCRLTKWDIAEDANTGALTYTATYERPEDSIDPEQGDPGSEDPEEEDYEIETAREYSGGSENRDLTHDAETGVPVLLPTGEPFDNVPSVPVPTWSFKVTKKTELFPKAEWAAHGTVNAAEIEIDGCITIPPRCGLLSVAVTRLYNEEMTYQVSLTISIVSKKVILEPGGELTEIGHDTALLLAGYKHMMEVSSSVAVAVESTIVDEKTGESTPTKTPVLLDREGKLYTPEDPKNPQGYYTRYATIKSSEWDVAWFDPPNKKKEENTSS